MRIMLPRIALLCLLLGLSHCASDTVAVLVHVKNLPSGISVLQVNATLDGKPALQTAEFTQSLEQFAITIPKSAIEAGQLVIEVTGADTDRCKLTQKSRIDTTVSKDISYSESAVSLQALSEALCTLTVDIVGEGTVIPDPVGIVPDKLGIACKLPGPCDYPKMAGRVVTLTSSRGGSYFVTDWGQSCPGQSYASSGTCKITLNQATKVRVRLSDGFCSTDNWCWSNPAPQGYFLDGVWGFDSRNVWMVGNLGTIMKWDGISWQRQESNTTQTLSAVWGSSPTDVWAVGTAGTILRWNGAAWSAIPSATSAYLSGVWGSNPDNVWIVGNDGSILYWNGSSFTRSVPAPKKLLTRVWGLDASNVWAVGLEGTILKFDGTTWMQQNSGTDVSLLGIWGSGTNSVWAGGTGGVITKWNGTAWARELSTDTTQSIYRISGKPSDPNNVWAAGTGGSIIKWDGTKWTQQTSGTERDIYGIWVLDQNNIWAGGDLGTILKFDGGTWNALSNKPNKTDLTDFTDIWGTAADNIYAVGQLGSKGATRTVLRRSGQPRWEVQFEGVKGTSWSIWGSDMNNIWTFGQAGIGEADGSVTATPNILRSDGTTWSPVANTPVRNLFSAWGTGPNQLWVGTDIGSVLYWNGSSWTQQQDTGATGPLYGLWGADPSHVWATGRDGVIAKWDGSKWSREQSGTGELLLSLWGYDTRNLWAVGKMGAVLKSDGAEWSLQNSGTMQGLWGVWGADATHVWAVGEGGSIIRWDGNSWTSQTSGTQQVLHGIWGTDAHHIWTVGSKGTILNYLP